MPKRLLTIAMLLIASVGWATLFLPPVDYYASHQDAGWGATFTALLNFRSAVFPGQPAVGWLFLLSSLALLLWLLLAALQLLSAALAYVEQSETTVSVLETTFRLQFLDPGLSQTIMTREQKLHANRQGVAAYPYIHNVNATKGRIVDHSLQLNSYIDRQRITKEVLILDSSDRHVDAVEVLERTLPRSVFTTYLPDWLILALYELTPLLDRVIVKRHGEIRHLDEYNDGSARLEFQSGRFATKNLSVFVSVPLEAADRIRDLRCFLRGGHAVTEVSPQVMIVNDHRVWEIYVSNFSQQILRLQWNVAELDATAQSTVGAPYHDSRRARWNVLFRRQRKHLS